MVKASRNRDRGKDLEKAMAKIFNGKRMGVLGGEDIFHPIFSIECKSKVKFSARKIMEQCKRNNKDSKIPLCVIHEPTKMYMDSLVMLDLDDFLKLIDNFGYTSPHFVNVKTP